MKKKKIFIDERAKGCAVVLLACILIMVVGSLALVAYYYLTGKI